MGKGEYSASQAMEHASLGTPDLKQIKDQVFLQQNGLIQEQKIEGPLGHVV